MDPTYIIAAVAVAIVVIGTLMHVVLSATMYRHKWTVALRTAQELLQKGTAAAVRRRLASDLAAERLGAAMAFSELSTRGATKALCQTLANDKDADVRSAAANALGSRASAEVIAALSRAATGDSSPVVRGAAVEALGLTRSERAVPALVDALKEASTRAWRPGLRARVAIATMAGAALGKIGGGAAIAAVGAAQTSPHGAIRHAAEQALSLIKLRQTASEDTADADTLRKLAAAYVVNRDFAEAIRWLEQAARIEPTHAETFETLGTLHQKLGDHQRAARWYNKAIELAPDEPFPHFGMGIIYRKRDEKAAAIEAFKRYLEVAPDGDQARSAREFVAELAED